MLRIAIQAKGRLNEDTTALLTDAGIAIASSKRKLIARASGFELEAVSYTHLTLPTNSLV